MATDIAVIQADDDGAVTHDRTVEEGQLMVGFTRRTSPRTTATEGTSRRAFLRSSGGYATGVAAVVGIPAAVLLESTDAEAATTAPRPVANPTTAVPDGPVMAYVHDAKKGTVVIMSGTTERTVQDRALVDKLLHAPKKPKKAKRKRATLTATKMRG